MTNEEREAFERGKREGEIHTLNESVGRAHTRLDKHDVRMTALEKVMYMGMGVVAIINILPIVASWAGK
jgi:cell division protein FtsL